MMLPQVCVFSQVLAIFLIQYGRRKGVRSTGVLCSFWLLHTIAAIFILRERILDILEEVR